MSKIKLTDLKLKDENGTDVGTLDSPAIVVDTKGIHRQINPSKLFAEVEDITAKHQMQRYIFIIFVLATIYYYNNHNEEDNSIVIVSKKDSEGVPYIEDGIFLNAVYAENNGKHVWFKIPVAIFEKYAQYLIDAYDQEFAPKWDGVHTSTESLLEFLDIQTQE
jgi:hypothetical protein